MAKFCSNCGTEVKSSEQDICLNCGKYLNGGNKNQQNLPSNGEDHGNVGFMVLSIFFPMVGLILYLVNKDTKPITAKQAGKGAIIGVCIGAAFMILCVILNIIIYSIEGTTSSYYYSLLSYFM